jgi:hypothetical protein
MKIKLNNPSNDQEHTLISFIYGQNHFVSDVTRKITTRISRTNEVS